MHSSIIFRKFVELCNHHHSSVLEHLHPKKFPQACFQSISTPSSVDLPSIAVDEIVFLTQTKNKNKSHVYVFIQKSQRQRK